MVSGFEDLRGEGNTSSIGKSPKGKSLKPVMLRKVTSSAPSVK